MSNKRLLAIGCGIVFLFCGALFLALVGFLAYAIQDPEGVGLRVEGPDEVAVGETFDLRVIVTNERPSDSVALSDIDIADEYLAGFTISTVTPDAESSMHVPIDNSQSYTFNVSIPPGESREFVFSLRAEQEGIYRGDVDACEGARFITQIAETVVRAK